MSAIRQMKRILAAMLVLAMVFSMMPATAFAAGTDETLESSLAEAKSYIDGITINNSSNEPATVVKNFGTHFTWDNEKRESSKSYLFDWSYYNGVVFEGIEYVYEVTGDSTYKDYVVEYMSSLISSDGTWAMCTNNSSKQCAGYNSTHGADCYKTASLLVDAYQMTGDSRYLTMAETLYADLDTAAKSYSLSNAGNNYRHTWASDPSPDLWLDGLYMILPFRAEYAAYIGDTEELDLIVDRMQWVSDNMYNSSKGLFYHAADSASSNSGTFWLRSIGWYAAAIVDIMDHMSGDNLTAMKAQLVKLVDGMKACQNSSNGMWLNNMAASQSSSNPYETSGTALTCYAVMKAVNNGWLDESYADMAILAFNGICSEKLSGSTLTDICFKGAPGSSNSTFYDNEGKGVGPFIMLYAEVLKYVNEQEEEVPETTVPEETEPEETEPEATEPEETEPEATEPEATEPEVTEPEETEPEEETGYQGTGYLESSAVYTLDTDGIDSGSKYVIVYNGRALENNNGVDNNPTVTISSNTITLEDDTDLAWVITQSSGSNYYVENNGSYVNLSSNQTDPIGSSATVYITLSSSTYTFRNAQSSGGYLRYSSSQLWCVGSNNSNNKLSLYRQTGSGTGDQVVFTVAPVEDTVMPGETVALSGSVTVGGESVSLSSCTITWASSDTAVATVSGGSVTGISGGNATITATLSAVNGTALQEAIVLSIPVSVQDHVYEAVVTAPTCTEQGYTTYICANCGESYVGDYTAALGHSYETVTVEATCSEDGSVTYTCACGDTYTEVIPATGEHDYEAVVTAPTCTEQGYTTYTCACGESYVGDYTEAVGHSYETVTMEATCTEEGSITYTCHCGHSYSETIAATGHAYTDVITAPTCTEAGYITHTCEACGDSYVDGYSDALGHSYEAVTVEATCSEDGFVTYTCACGDTYTEVIPATGEHDYEAVVTAPTCTEQGYTTYTCACGESYVGDYTEAVGHSYETVTVAPTCSEDGSVTYTCVCGDTYTEVIPATGEHVYQAETVEATCTENGSITYTCGCGESYSEVIEATGHDYESVTVDPTCTEEGYTCYTCSVCNDGYFADETAALGHDYESVTVEPTCTEGGYTTHTCARCGDSYVSDETEALGHDNVSVVTEATCETAGYTTHTCARCGNVTVDCHTDALGHDYETVTVEATCTEVGSVTVTCQRCGESSTQTIEALGHDYEAVVTDPTCTEAGYTTYTCANCGDSYVSDETDALGHDYETVTVEATCTENGSVTTTCQNCGDSSTEIIEALGHSYESVVTAPTCTEGGYTTCTCANCSDSYVSDETGALGHSYESVVTAPTCTEGGYTTHTCANCGDSYVGDETEALGHSYVCEETEDCLVYTCENCGDVYTESIGWIELGNVYTLDTDGIDVGEGHKYIVVGSSQDYALTVSGSTISSAAVTVEDDTITLEDASAYEFYFADNSSQESGTYLLTQDGTNGVYHMGGYIYYGADDKGYWYFGTSSDGAYQIYDYDNLNWYLNYGYVWSSESVDRFAVSSNARSLRLFQATTGYIRLTGEMLQTCTDADGITEADVLAKLSIQTSTDGSNVSGTASVTADMLTWDTEFDGTTAGTYTAVVTSSGVELGSVTVTVTSKHSYETTVVEPTCTECGYTLRTCTECGVSYESAHTEALGHSYTGVESDGYMVYTCDRCGDSYSEKLVSYTKVSSISSGNSYVITFYSNSAYYALSHANNQISVVQVTVTDGEITSEITEDLLWDYSGSKLSYVSGSTTYYMYASSSGWGGWWGSFATLSLSTSSSSTVSFSSSKLKVGSYYLRYSSGTVSVNRSSSTVYMFVEG